MDKVSSEYSDSVLVLLGHGTTQNENSAAVVYQHAAELRQRHCFGEVREAFWKQEPQVKHLLSSISAPRTFLAPMFISEGYFSEEVIPRELGFLKAGQPEWSRMLCLEGRRLYYCKPVGTHKRMTEVILARARESLVQFPPTKPIQADEITLLIAGHGTEKNENSRKAVERQVSLIRKKRIYADVHPIFLEEEPRIDRWHEFVKTRNAVVVPFFISDGLHTQEDIPMLLGAPRSIVQQRFQRGEPVWANPTEIKGKLVWYTLSVGTAPEIAEVIMERVAEIQGAGFKLKPAG